MNKITAEMLSKLMIEFGARLNESVASVQANATPEEFDAYRKAVGAIMGEMLLGIMNPLYLQFPDLKPAELK